MDRLIHSPEKYHCEGKTPALKSNLLTTHHSKPYLARADPLHLLFPPTSIHHRSKLVMPEAILLVSFLLKAQRDRDACAHGQRGGKCEATACCVGGGVSVIMRCGPAHCSCCLS